MNKRQKKKLIKKQLEFYYSEMLPVYSYRELKRSRRMWHEYIVRVKRYAKLHPYVLGGVVELNDTNVITEPTSKRLELMRECAEGWSR